MKAKLLLLLCCLFAIEGWANSNDIHLLKDSRSNPMGIPIQPIKLQVKLYIPKLITTLALS